MRALLRLPVIRSLHQRQLLFPVVLALVVVGVLALGAVQQGELAEAIQQPAAEPAAVEVPRPAVSRADLQKTPLTYVSDYWAQLAEQSRPKLTLIGESPIAAVLIGPRLAVAIIEARRRDALTRAPEAEDAEVLPPPEEVGPFRLRGWDAGVGLALFDLTRAGGPAFTLTDPRGMLSGSYLGAVTLGPEGTATITPGYFVTTVPDEIDATLAGDLVVSMDLPSTLDIAAVVTLDGELVGVAYTTPGGTE